MTVLMVISANKNRNMLPCEHIPKLFCCTEFILEICIGKCIDIAAKKCHKKLSLHKFYSRFSKKSNDVTNAEIKPLILIFIAPFEKYSIGASIARPPNKVISGHLSSDCGSASNSESSPPYSPCPPKNIVDDFFLHCCKQQQLVEANCHGLCSYEHREQQISELLTHALRKRLCSCLGMCNIEHLVDSDDKIMNIKKNYLVCFSNWNILIHCAHAGIRYMTDLV
ncbi:unnamed protein product [Dracunculus medinensis]|uniref:DB domain-containing protein n=1 Tax=Dracunculus medinensis TaxID=318479 RepID=A0A0N4U8U8_DRAME|nr:unnamed protein product [Dracunculus medinensis]